MVKTTSSPKGSSSFSSVSRNPPATTQSYEMVSFSKDPLFNGDDVSISTIPKTSMGCLSDKDSGKEQINGVQEERFTFMGSSSSSNPRIAEGEFQRYIAFKKDNRPTTTHDQSMASLASINGGDLVGKYPSLLDEIELNDLVRVAELKLGSLNLQKIPKDKNPLYFNNIFSAALKFTYPLMFDPEETSPLQKLYYLSDSNNLQLIVEKILLCPDDTGSGTFTKLFEFLISTDPLLHKFIVCALDSEFVSMMTSKHGSRQFRFILKDLDPLQTEFVYNRAATYCTELATDSIGYASLIALIENTPNSYKRVLLLKITDNAVYLSQDPNGNYVIQATLFLQYPDLDCMICEKLVGTYLRLSVDKFACHVVQKCIKSSGMEYPILELISSKELHLLAQDRFGNYVVQAALQATRCNRLDFYYGLVGEIGPYLEDLKYHHIGRHVCKNGFGIKLIRSPE